MMPPGGDEGMSTWVEEGEQRIYVLRGLFRDSMLEFGRSFRLFYFPRHCFSLISLISFPFELEMYRTVMAQ